MGKMGEIRITVKVFGTLRKYVPDYDHEKGIKLDILEGSTLGDLIYILRLPPNEARLIFVKGISKKITDTLRDLDEVSIFLPIAGG